MNRQTRTRIVLLAGAALVLALIVFAFLPEPVTVETAPVRRAQLQVIVEEEGVTEVADRFAIVSPVAAYVRRINLEVGDPVKGGEPLIWLEPPRTPMLDTRTRSEAVAHVRAAEATARTAAAEHERMTRLAAAGAATQQALETAAGEARRTAAELTEAEAALRRTEGGARLTTQLVLRAPVSGAVLAVPRPSEGPANPGDTLLVVGNPQGLQIRVDVLSEDAVRIRPGTPILVEQWGGAAPLTARTQRVEPQGFMEISSLGVEEQRVSVIGTLTSAPETRARLGAGYRVLARFIVHDEARALQAPTGALFRTADGWAAFVVHNGRARRRSVRIGLQAGLVTQIAGGLAEGDVVIVHPPNEVHDGSRVR